MMRERLIALRERRARLVAGAESQRSQLFAAFDKVDRVAAWVDRGRAAGRRALAHPVWIAAGVAFVVALRPGRALKLAATGLSLWRTYRKLRATLDRFVPTPARGTPF